MKKYFKSACAIGSFTFLISQNISAQQLKIGVFDIDGMVRVLPEYKTIDSLMHIFEEDSLQLQYYTFLDSLLQKGCDGLMGMSESERKKIDSLKHCEKLNVYYTCIPAAGSIKTRQHKAKNVCRTIVQKSNNRFSQNS